MEAEKVKWTFQIGALPRSGTTWLASLLNMHEGVFCFHDALQSFNGKYIDAPASVDQYPHRGDSSSYCCMRPHDDRSVYIDREWTECYASLKKHKMHDNFDEIFKVCKSWACDVPNFYFTDIFGDDRDRALYKLQAIFDIIVPGVKLNEEKANVLLPVKVEPVKIGPSTYNLDQIKWRMN